MVLIEGTNRIIEEVEGLQTTYLPLAHALTGGYNTYVYHYDGNAHYPEPDIIENSQSLAKYTTIHEPDNTINPVQRLISGGNSVNGFQNAVNSWRQTKNGYMETMYLTNLRNSNLTTQNLIEFAEMLGEGNIFIADYLSVDTDQFFETSGPELSINYSEESEQYPFKLTKFRVHNGKIIATGEIAAWKDELCEPETIKPPSIEAAAWSNRNFEGVTEEMQLQANRIARELFLGQSVEITIMGVSALIADGDNTEAIALMSARKGRPFPQQPVGILTTNSQFLELMDTDTVGGLIATNGDTETHNKPIKGKPLVRLAKQFVESFLERSFVRIPLRKVKSQDYADNLIPENLLTNNNGQTVGQFFIFPHAANNMVEEINKELNRLKIDAGIQSTSTLGISSGNITKTPQLTRNDFETASDLCKQLGVNMGILMPPDEDIVSGSWPIVSFLPGNFGIARFGNTLPDTFSRRIGIRLPITESAKVSLKDRPEIVDLLTNLAVEGKIDLSIIFKELTDTRVLSGPPENYETRVRAFITPFLESIEYSIRELMVNQYNNADAKEQAEQLFDIETLIINAVEKFANSQKEIQAHWSKKKVVDNRIPRKKRTHQLRRLGFQSIWQ